MDSHHAPLAQLDRVTGYEPVGRRFESCTAHHFVLGAYLFNHGEMAESAEGGRLLSDYTGSTCIEGSNPSLSVAK